MEDIAKQLNISKVSVHKALAGKSDISEELRRKVIDCAIANNYKFIDPLTKLCRTFYYITPQIFNFSSEQFYNGIFIDLQNHFANLDVSIENYVAENDFSVKSFVQRQNYRNDQMFAVFWAGIIPDKILKDFNDFNIPLICIDNYIEDSSASYVYIDQYHAGYNITEYLIEAGHREICFIIETSISSNVDKYFGFRKALYTHNIPFKDSMHINLSLSKIDNFRKFKLPQKMPSAFLFDSDYSAQNFMIMMMSKGYSIPKDFSVASFDNTKLADETTPKLTSIGAARDDITKACYRAMLRTLSKQSPQSVLVNTTLFERQSVAKRQI